jgi:hypothetical protein
MMKDFILRTAMVLSVNLLWYTSLDFIAQLPLHIPRAAVTLSVTGGPPRGRHLVRRYGLYSSRGRGTWKHHPALASRAPENWYGRTASADSTLPDASKDQEVGASSRRKAWARLLAKVHELDVMAYLNRHSRGPPPLG